MANDFLKGMMKASGDEYGSLVSDGIVGNGAKWYLDSGCYAMNALISGDLFKGLSSNRGMVLAGEESTGKTFYALEMVYHFLKDNPDGQVIYFDTEKSLEESMFEKRGIDTKRVLVQQPSTIQGFRTQAINILERYEKKYEEPRPKMLMVLDSMGMLSSQSEVDNMIDGKDVADMKKSQLWKAAFRAMILKMGILNAPMLIVGHTYANIGGYGPKRVVAGGCLAEGTMVRTPTGTVGIETLMVGDEILTRDGVGNVTNVWDRETLINPDAQCYEIEFSDGSTIVCSEDHKFFVGGKSVGLLDIINDNISILDSTSLEKLEIRSIKKVPSRNLVDIEVANHGSNYILENGIVSSNSGAKYAASTIIELSKAKEKDNGEQIGVVITATTVKSRMSREGEKVKTTLLFNDGLDRYSGMLELAERSGVFKKLTAGRYETPTSGDAKIFGKHIKADPQKYFTKEVMDEINEWVKENMSLGGSKRYIDDEDEV